MGNQIGGIGDVGAGLQHPAASADQVLESAQLTRFRECRRKRPGPAGVTVDLVEKQLLRGQADEAGIQRLVEHAFHLGLFTGGGPHLGAGGAVESHGGGPDVGMSEESRNIRTQRPSLQRADISLGTVPCPGAVDCGDDVFPGDRLHAAEQVSGVPPADVDRGQRAGADQNGGDTVPNRLGQSGTVEHFDVVVRVDVHEPGQHPLAGSVDDLRTAGVVEFIRGHRGNAAADDADGANGRRGTGSVEPASVSNDGVVTRSVTHRHSKPRW